MRRRARTALGAAAASVWRQRIGRTIRGRLCASARLFVEFSAEDAARYQLLFQRMIPDFEPSPESYALALEVFDEGRRRIAAVGLLDSAHFDMWTALVSGLAAQQLANDPAATGGSASSTRPSECSQTMCLANQRPEDDVHNGPLSPGQRFLSTRLDSRFIRPRVAPSPRGGFPKRKGG
jgi:hypothetical protein